MPYLENGPELREDSEFFRLAPHGVEESRDRSTVWRMGQGLSGPRKLALRSIQALRPWSTVRHSLALGPLRSRRSSGCRFGSRWVRARTCERRMGVS